MTWFMRAYVGGYCKDSRRFGWMASTCVEQVAEGWVA
jgi:hypothetical protein